MAVADTAYTTAEDTPLVLTVLANDSDVDGPLPLSVARINGNTVTTGQTVNVTGGTVKVNADGTLTFSPAANSNTDGAFTYTAKDGSGLEGNTVSVAVDVTPVNDAPTVGFNQGFETGDAGVFDGDSGWSGNVAVVTSFGTITAPDGGAFAVMTQGGPVGDETGPFTRFDGYRSQFVDGLTDRRQGLPRHRHGDRRGLRLLGRGQRRSGTHLRDFVFHVTKDSSTGSCWSARSTGSSFDPPTNLESGPTARSRRRAGTRCSTSSRTSAASWSSS